MQITLNTDDLSATDMEVLALLSGNGFAKTPALPATATKAAPAKAAPAKAAAAPAKEADGPTLADAVSAATALVSTGEAAKVKEALAAVSAKRVSELAEGDIPAFLAALEA